MGNIVRTPTQAKGGITDDEKRKMSEIVEKWKRIAFQTGRCDRAKLTEAIKGIYRSANLKEPRVVIVDSPLIMACAYGLSAGVWYLRKHGVVNNINRATDDATLDATLAATHNATDIATDRATHNATHIATDIATGIATDAATLAATDRATDDATRNATDIATLDATLAATHIATDIATRNATYDATDIATLDATHDATDAENWLSKLAKHFGGQNYKLLLQCIRRWSTAYQGGNMWAGFQAYADACQNVLGLTGLDCWEKFEPYRQAAIHGGFRVMHEEFCIVSDFPEILKVDEQNRPHNEHGPSHRWRDGFEIYHLHGVRFPKELYLKVVGRELSAKDVLKIEDIDQRTQAMKFAKDGVRDFYKAEGGKIVDTYEKVGANGIRVRYELWNIPKGKTFSKDVKFMVYDCPTALNRKDKREYSKGVPVEVKSVAEAMSWGMSSDEYAITPQDWELMEPLLQEA